MNKTKIEWVKNPDGTQGYTLNPITGCKNHTPEGLCLGGMFPCYAYKLANGRLKQRYLANKNLVFLKGRGLAACGSAGTYIATKDPFYPRFWEDKLIRDFPDIGRKAKPKGIFVCDMSDLFGIGIPEEWTRKVLDRFQYAPQHRFYLLTKQPQNLIKFSPFPDNCWVGVTATNADMLFDAINHLDDIQCSKRFVSIEPMLASCYLEDLPAHLAGTLDWVIIGQQTPIKKATMPKIEHIEEIVRACDKAGIPVFLKDNLRPLFRQVVLENTHCLTYPYGELRQEIPQNG